MTCILQLTDENVGSVVPVPAPYPAHWFPKTADEFEPPEGWEPTRMNWFDCDGRYVSVLAEDGVPYTHEYPDMDAPVTVGAESYYMNERAELPVQVIDRAGVVSEVPAGPIGIEHSPKSLAYVDELFAWHDRDLSKGWGGASMERVFVRARLIEWDRYLLAVGGLVPGVTQGELQVLQNLEVSPEFYVVRNAAGQKQMQIITASFVKQGNSRTSASSIERRAATIRFVEERATVEAPVEMIAAASFTAGYDFGQASSSDGSWNGVTFTFTNGTGTTVPAAAPSGADAAELALLRELADVDLDLTPLPDLHDAGVVGETALAKKIVGYHDLEKETREQFYRRIAEKTGWDESTVKQVINGQISCPPIGRLEAIASMFPGLSVDALVSAAESDGCQRYGD